MSLIQKENIHRPVRPVRPKERRKEEGEVIALSVRTIFYDTPMAVMAMA